MKKSGLISVAIILGVIGILFYLPYINFLVPEHKIQQDNQLIELVSVDNIWIKLSLLTFFIPVIVIFESTFWKTRNIWYRFILIIQAILMFWGVYIFLVLTSLSIFSGKYEINANYYMIIGYLILGGILNILLAIPFFYNHKLITGIFKKLPQK